MEFKGIISVTPKLMIQLNTQPAPDFFWNGHPFDIGGRELVPDQKVRHLHKKVTAIGKWSRGRMIVTGIVRGAIYGNNGDYTYLVECETTRKLIQTGRPQVIDGGKNE
jgi:hypothetical protein